MVLLPSALAPLRTIVNQGELVLGVAASRDGDTLASFGRERSVFLWDAKTGRQIRTLPIERGRFRAIAFSPTDDVLVSGASDGVIRVWSTQTGQEILPPIKHGPPVLFVRVSPDGKRALSAGESGAVRVWDLATGELVEAIPSGKSDIADVRFGPHGETLAVATRDGVVRLWDIQTRETLQRFEPNAEADRIALSDDGATLAVSTYGGALRIWSAAAGELRDIYPLYSGRINALEFLKDSPVLAAAASDGRTHMIDTLTNRKIRATHTHMSLSNGTLARSANGKWLVVGSGDGSVKALSAPSVARPSVYWQDTAVRGVAFLPGGKRFIAVSDAGVLQTWDLVTGQVRQLNRDDDHRGTRLAVQPDGDVAVTADASGRMAIWDTSAGKLLRKVDAPLNGIDRVAFSPSGLHLAVGGHDGAVAVYSVGKLDRPEFTTSPLETRVDALAFSPDAALLAVALETGQVRLLDVAANSWRAGAIDVPARARALAFCESGGLLAIAAENGEIHLWEPDKNRRRAVIKAHSSRINALAVLNDTTLLSASRDRALKLWDTPSTQLITTLTGHRRQIFCIAAAPGGHAVISGGLEGDIRLWQVPPAK